MYLLHGDHMIQVWTSCDCGMQTVGEEVEAKRIGGGRRLHVRLKKLETFWNKI